MTNKLKVLDLFSGIGGFSRGLEMTGGFETVAFCEIEDRHCNVLKKHWPDVHVYKDVRKLNGKKIIKNHGPIDLVCGGYPCQPFSFSGNRSGTDDDRNLWPEMLRIVASTRPGWVIAENVAGHVTLGLDEVLSDLESEDYTAAPIIIPACAVDAPQRRDRVWIVANDNRKHGLSPSINKAQSASTVKIVTTSKQSTLMASTNRQRRRGGNSKWENAKNVGQSPIYSRNNTRRMEMWKPEPPVGRVANGIPGRVDRLKQLGNAVVPQIPEQLGKVILEIINWKAA